MKQGVLAREAYPTEVVPAETALHVWLAMVLFQLAAALWALVNVEVAQPVVLERGLVGLTTHSPVGDQRALGACRLSARATRDLAPHSFSPRQDGLATWMGTEQETFVVSL